MDYDRHSTGVKLNCWAETDVVHFTALFTRVSDNTPQDPTSVLFYYQVDEGEVTTLAYFPGGGPGEIIRDSVGAYHVDIDTTGLPGCWLYRFAGVGSAQASGWARMIIEHAPIP